jgi:hypothetical protein
MRHAAHLPLILLTVLLLGCGERSDAQRTASMHTLATTTSPVEMSQQEVRSVGEPASVDADPLDPHTKLQMDALRFEIEVRRKLLSEPPPTEEWTVVWERLGQRMNEWASSPWRGSWRERYFPPDNVAPPEAMMVLAGDEAERATRLRGIDARRLVNDLRNLPGTYQGMEFLLDTGITDSIQAIQIITIMGGRMDFSVWSPLAILLATDSALAQAVMATVLGGERAPTGPG